MVRAKINGVDVVIYGYEIIKGVQTAICAVPGITNKINYPINLIEVSYDSNDL